ncbi:MAG: hypothetical protein GQ532_11820 [Methylomarinum sp.]|nr:hypothetical protein [Methylomarinum sp.]
MSKNKKIIFAHGDKGGSGKSTISAVIADYYLTKGITPLIVEGDGTIPDVGRRYDGYARCINAPLGGDDPVEMVAQLIDVMEKAEEEIIIVNLPASAGETLDPLAVDLIGPSLQEIALEVIVLFAIAKTEDSSLLAAQSAASGIASIALPHNRIAVINGFFGSPDKFDWASSEHRSAWLDNGSQEVYLPRLHDRVIEVVQIGPFSQYVAPGGGLSIANRMLVNKWIKQAHLIGDLIEGKE